MTVSRCTITLLLLLLTAVVQIKSFTSSHHRRTVFIVTKQESTQRPPLFSSSQRRNNINSDEDADSSSTNLFKVDAVSRDASPIQQQQRRAFLSSIASTATATSLLTSNPRSVLAYSYVTSDVLVLGSDEIMLPKAHGTTDKPVQENLRFGVSRTLADRICCYNRMFAEMGGYFDTSTTFEKDVRQYYASSSSSNNSKQPMIFYDSVSGLPLFRAPIGRSVDDFIAESKVHGWPSFRDDEVVWDNVRILKNGETVSVAGTHLGHDIPDGKGNRYCINLVSVAGNPA